VTATWCDMVSSLVLCLCLWGCDELAVRLPGRSKDLDEGKCRQRASTEGNASSIPSYWQFFPPRAMKRLLLYLFSPATVAVCICLELFHIAISYRYQSTVR
jgi:hypothetical protein